MKPLSVTVSDGPDFQIAIPGEAHLRKAEALEASHRIDRVSNEAEEREATKAVATIKALTSGMEKTREEIKRPFLEAGRAIDARAKEYAADLLTEARRIESLIGARQAIIRAEADRVRREAEEAKRRIDEEAQREREKAAEALAKAERARSDAGREKALTEAWAATARAQEATDSAASLRAQLKAPEVKPEGMTVGKRLEITVTDPAALYRAQPHLVELEPRTQEIRYWLEIQRQAGKPMELPGVSVIEVTKATVRAGTL